MGEIVCMLYNLAIIGITCYMCANYSYWFLLLLLLTGSYKSERNEWKMLEVKKLKDFMKERGIQEGEQFAMLPLTNWYMFDDCFGQIIGLFDEQELNENYIVLTDRPFKLKFEDILEKYHFEDGEIIENE